MESNLDQLQVLKALVTGSTIRDAAEAAGVHRSTVHDWTHVHQEFRAALDAARHNYAQLVEDELRLIAAASTALLRKFIEDESTPASLRLRAALAVVKSVVANSPAKHAVAGTRATEAEFSHLLDAAFCAADGRKALDQVAVEPTKAEPAAEPPAPQGQSHAVAIPRSAPCPCGSGAKYKRCCGITAPPQLGGPQIQNDKIRQNPTRQPISAAAGAGR